MKKLFLIIMCIAVTISIYQLNEQSIIIPTSAIRLRVIPNSNKPIDINIKEQVKEYLEKHIYTLTQDITDIDEARSTIIGSIPQIEDNINNIFINNDYPLTFNVNYGLNYFPQKQYKGITYKEGYYESLVIELGEANGDNWWCVLFPNFCLTDYNEDREAKLYLKELISKYSKKAK